jgi:hypothetical protein
MLAGSDRYLQNLGNIDPDWEMELFYYKRSQCSAAALLPCSARKEASSKANNPIFLFKKNLKSIQLIQRWQMTIQSTLMIHSQGNPFISNAYIL